MKTPTKPPLKLVTPPKTPAGPDGLERIAYIIAMTTLVAPFLAALIIFAASVVAGLIGRGPASLIALDLPGQLAWAAQKAMDTYVWCAIPAALGGTIAAAAVHTRNALHWLAGATVGAIVPTIFAVLAGGMLAQHVTPIAFIGAVVGVAMVVILKRAGLAGP